MGTLQKQYDYIIIGAGSAGCVLANKLSANGQYSVCLLEAGPKDNHWSIKIPLGVIDLMKNHRLNWQFHSSAETTQNNRSIFNPRGKTLGGSSSINAMLYVRGQAEDYDHWASLGNKGWSYADVLPYFKASQHQERGEDEFHGTAGELNVAECRSKQAIFYSFIESANNAGFELNDDFNGATQEGIGFYQVTQKNGYRHSAATAFLTPILQRTNLTVITDVSVQKILIDNKEAKGVRVKLNNKCHEIFANKEVILSAGAFNSPQLLMLSGIGCPEELAKHNIEIKQALPGVGKNLQEHVDALIVQKHDRTDLLAYRPKAAFWAFKQALQFFKYKTGILTSPVAEAGGFIKSSTQLTRPDLQLHFIPAAMDDHGRNNQMLLNYGVSLHVCLLRPKSRGTVTLHGKNPCLHPKIQLNMLSEQEDITTMVQAVKIARNILAQSPLAEKNGKELIPGDECQTDEEIIEFLKQKANTIYHPVGTCKMGNDEMAVVDDQLKVHGLKNLRVVDASIMPTLISGNTNAPTIMIAAKAAEMILADN
jgi:choline dehydrogenase-like flavoprotein